MFDGGKGLADFFSYPFDDKRHGALSPQRIAAELFARLAVIYHGDQALMKRSPNVGVSWSRFLRRSNSLNHNCL